MYLFVTLQVRVQTDGVGSCTLTMNELCHHRTEWTAGPGTNGILINNSTDVTVADITLMHVSSWMIHLESNVGVHVHGIKEFGWRCNNDGIDIVSSQDVLVENVFIRSADDAIAVKGLDASMETKDVVVRDSFFFPYGAQFVGQ
jgi:polygalacturonase